MCHPAARTTVAALGEDHPAQGCARRGRTMGDNDGTSSGTEPGEDALARAAAMGPLPAFTTRTTRRSRRRRRRSVGQGQGDERPPSTSAADRRVAAPASLGQRGEFSHGVVRSRKVGSPTSSLPISSIRPAARAVPPCARPRGRRPPWKYRTIVYSPPGVGDGRGFRGCPAGSWPTRPRPATSARGLAPGSLVRPWMTCTKPAWSGSPTVSTSTSVLFRNVGSPVNSFAVCAHHSPCSARSLLRRAASSDSNRTTPMDWP